jgi:hypothetical protein
MCVNIHSIKTVKRQVLGQKFRVGKSLFKTGIDMGLDSFLDTDDLKSRIGSRQKSSGSATLFDTNL